jgi:glycosyltransferase involved in cell wall biosynthesis
MVPEPYGQVIIEAMLAGVPIIATEGGGPSEILTNDLDGLLYPAGDIDALAEALQRLNRDAALRARLVANARHRAQQFSPEAAAAKVMPLYRSVLGK